MCRLPSLMIMHHNSRVCAFFKSEKCKKNGKFANDISSIHVNFCTKPNAGFKILKVIWLYTRSSCSSLASFITLGTDRTRLSNRACTSHFSGWAWIAFCCNKICFEKAGEMRLELPHSTTKNCT